VAHPDTSPAACGQAPEDASSQRNRLQSRPLAATPAANPEEPGRVIRDCQHPQVHHEHGTRTAYVLDRCRCSPCTTANRLEAQRRRTAIAYGRWTGLVPAEAARQHVQQLRAVGLSLHRIATISTVGYGTVARLIYGDPSRRQPPTTRLRHQTQQQLLTVPLDTCSVAPGGRVDAIGSQRRLRALIAVGWPLPTLALSLGRSPGNLRRTMQANTVTAQSADRIVALYDGLCDTPPPNRTPVERANAARTQTDAAQSGWLPPWAWDDIDHDNDNQPNDSDQEGDCESWLDEIAIEAAMHGDPVRLTRAERDEAIARLTHRGISARRIAALLGTSSRNVVRRRAARRAA
jgi:hypothetical protein